MEREVSEDQTVLRYHENGQDAQADVHKRHPNDEDDGGEALANDEEDDRQ